MATINVHPPQAYTRETLAQAYLWLKGQPDSIKARAKTADTLVSLYLHACRHGLDVFKEDGGLSDAPRSTQDFKNTLKDLSKGIRQFEGAPNKSSGAPSAEVKVPAGVESPVPRQAPPPNMNPSAPRVSPQPSTPPPRPAMPPQAAPVAPQAPPPEAPVMAGPLPPQQPPIHPQQVQIPVTEEGRAYPSPETRGYDPSPAYRAYFYDENPSLSETSYPPPQQAPSQQPLTLDPRSLDAIRRIQARMNLSTESEALRMLISLGFDRLRNILA